MKSMLKTAALLLTLTLAASLAACKAPASEGSGENLISLSDTQIIVNGENASEDSDAPVYLSSDIIYYEDKTAYDSGNPYGEGEEHERHTAEEAAAHAVINITEPGTYRLTGKLSKGQIRIDLGEDAIENPEAGVVLILDNADITCEVAPAILFLNVYECDNGWSAETASSDVNTAGAGAAIIIAEGSENNITGSHVARIYKDGPDEKKLWKQDGAVYSYMSMNVSGETEGTGILNITADNEGLDTELHLTINSGNINIFADNDGINTNEDGVSVTTINGGNIHILAGLGAEGDGIDSNGWLVINGGTVISSANPAADAGLDSDMGSYVNGGTVVALGSTMDWAESDSEQITMNLQFASYKDSGDDITVKTADGQTVFSFDPDEDPVLAGNARKYMGAVISSPDFAAEAVYNVFVGGKQQSYTGTDVRRGPGGMGFGGQMPEGMTPPDGFEPGKMPEGMQLPEGFDPGQMGFQPPQDMQMPESFDPSQMQGQMPEGFDPSQMQGQMPEAGTIVETGEARTDFYMQDKVNAFSGVNDAA